MQPFRWSSHSLLAAGLLSGIASLCIAALTGTGSEGPTPRPAVVPRVGPPYTVLPTSPPWTVIPRGPPSQSHLDGDGPALSPEAGSVRIPGHWRWLTDRYVWVPGHAATPPEPGAVWMQPEWTHAGGSIAYRVGFWRGSDTVYVPPPPALPITTRDTVHGAIEVFDLPRRSGALSDEYTVDLPQGRTISFLVWPNASGAAPTEDTPLSLYLWRDGVLVASDEAGAGSNEHEIVFTPERTAIYTLEITSTAGEPVSNKYTLQTAIQEDKPHRQLE